MPKVKPSIDLKLKKVVAKYPKELEVISGKLMCKLCVKEISFDHKHGIHNVNMHLDTNKHKDKKENNDSTQEFIEISLERMENNQF